MYLSGAFVASTSDVVDGGDGADDMVGVAVGDALNVAVGEALGLGFTPDVGTDIADGGICPIMGTEEPTSFVLAVPPEQPATRIIEVRARARMRVCKKNLEKSKAVITYIGLVPRRTRSLHRVWPVSRLLETLIIGIRSRPTIKGATCSPHFACNTKHACQRPEGRNYATSNCDGKIYRNGLRTPAGKITMNLLRRSDVVTTALNSPGAQTFEFFFKAVLPVSVPRP